MLFLIAIFCYLPLNGNQHLTSRWLIAKLLYVISVININVVHRQKHDIWDSFPCKISKIHDIVLLMWCSVSLKCTARAYINDNISFLAISIS